MIKALQESLGGMNIAEDCCSNTFASYKINEI